MVSYGEVYRIVRFGDLWSTLMTNKKKKKRMGLLDVLLETYTIYTNLLEQNR